VQVNHAVSYLALVDHTVGLLLDEEHSIERAECVNNFETPW